MSEFDGSEMVRGWDPHPTLPVKNAITGLPVPKPKWVRGHSYSELSLERGNTGVSSGAHVK